MTGSPIGFVNWISLAAAGVGVLFYFIALLRPPRGARLVQGSGLLFTSLGLGVFAAFPGHEAGAGIGADAGELLLMLAITIQAWSGLRRRRTYEGIDRRGPTVLG